MKIGLSSVSNVNIALGLVCLVPQVVAAGTGGEARAHAAEGSFALLLPDAQPPAFELAVPIEGTSVVLELERHSLRAPGAFVRVVGAGGVREDIEPPPVTTYRGSVRGDPASTVFASLRANRLSATVALGSGERYRIEPDARGRHVVRPSPPPEPFSCGSDELPVVGASGGSESFTMGSAGTDCLQRAEIALEADHPFFLAHGSVPDTIAALDALMNEVDLVYARDLQITHAITAYVVRTEPYYFPTDGSNLLGLFTHEWIDNQTDIRRDIAHLVIGPSQPHLGFAGMAWIGVVCDRGWHYGWSIEHAGVLTHELGHNWGAGHCHDGTGCDVMCNLCPEFGPNTKAIIEAFRDSRGCLEPAGPYPVPVPPYLQSQHITLRTDELEARSPLVFDVLAGSDDGNCDPLRVVNDRVSMRGASITRPRGERPGTLEYKLEQPFVGSDSFWYAATDGLMWQSRTASIELLPLEVTAYFPFDEGGGLVAADASGHGYEAMLLGAPGWNEGRFGSAVELDGSDDSVVLPRLDLRSDHVTITTWIYRDGAQPAWAGLVYTRAQSSVAGLHFGPGTPANPPRRLRYTWNGDAATYQWSAPQLVVPDRTWCFAALVVRPDKATLYLHDGAELRSATNRIPHALEEFDGETYLGQDPYPGRRFRGRMDDVRVYRYALSPAEIAALAAGSGPADAPSPRDGGKIADEGTALSWIPGPGASDHALYLGASFDAVRNATTSSPEFQGFFDPARFFPGPPSPGKTYYWRVDGAPSLTPGHVWQFRRRHMNRWGLDEKEGWLALDSGAGQHGAYYGNPDFQRPGATPRLGHSVYMDVYDYVSASLWGSDGPLYTDRATLTAWVRRDGHQEQYAGLVGLGGMRIGGLNFGPDDDLRYYWGNDWSLYDWSSGLLVPEGEWVFAALVVEPARARLYLSRNGILASAEHHPNLGHEPTRADNCYFGNGFRGSLDDVRFYDDALSSAQIEELYAQSR